jgi:hypothetical protein
MRNHADLDPDPQHWSTNVFYNFSLVVIPVIFLGRGRGRGEEGGRGLILGEISKSLQAIYAEGERGGGGRLL